jgi:hypothetical protein
MMFDCGESAPTKQKAFLTLQMLGMVGMCRRANVARCAFFLWTSEGFAQNSAMALVMDLGMPGFVVSA